MTNNKDFANSVNKFFFYINNFGSEYITYPALQGGEKSEWMPSFFKVFPQHLIQHMWSKYLYYCETESTAFAILKLYGDLDKAWRVKVLEFVNENYNEQELIKD